MCPTEDRLLPSLDRPASCHAASLPHFSSLGRLASSGGVSKVQEKDPLERTVAASALIIGTKALIGDMRGAHNLCKCLCSNPVRPGGSTAAGGSQEQPGSPTAPAAALTSSGSCLQRVGASWWQEIRSLPSDSHAIACHCN